MLLKNTTFKLAKSGNQQKLHWSFQTEDSVLSKEIVILNSYDKSLALKGGSGIVADICWNGQIFAEHQFNHKHIKNVDELIIDFLHESFADTNKLVSITKAWWEEMNHVNLTSDTKDYILGHLFRNDIFNGEQLNEFKWLLVEPDRVHDYTTIGVISNSLNEVYQLATYVMQSTHPRLYMNKRRKLEETFKELNYRFYE